MRFSEYVDQNSGTWTPTLTCQTPGDLSAGVAASVGTYVRLGKLVSVFFIVQPVPFTWTTASGQVFIDGFPFNSDVDTPGPLEFQGITKAGYSDFVAISPSPGDNKFAFRAGASGLNVAVVNIADLPSGGAVFLSAQITFTIEE